MQFILKKKDATKPYWVRLTKENKKYNNIAVIYTIITLPDRSIGPNTLMRTTRLKKDTRDLKIWTRTSSKTSKEEMSMTLMMSHREEKAEVTELMAIKKIKANLDDLDKDEEI
jgi:hypothetical protein